MLTNVSPKNISFMGKGVPQVDDNMITRPSASFMIVLTQLTLSGPIPDEEKKLT